MEQYQDIWVRGEVESPGVRNCADRYAAIAEFCKQYERPFTVLDLGANLGYFSLRLAEDFDCTVVAVESHYGDWLTKVLAKNSCPRVLFLRHHLTLGSLTQLAQVEHFDVTLALSVIHHLGAPFKFTLDMMTRLGDNLIVEIPTEKRACGQEIVQQRYIPARSELMGEFPSHLNGTRPMVLLRQNKYYMEQSYVGSLRPPRFKISSSFKHKVVTYELRREERFWHRGINLQTFLSYGGEKPTLETIASQLEKKYAEPIQHSDLRPWNVVVSGDDVHLIDYADPNVSDPMQFKTLLEHLRSSGD